MEEIEYKLSQKNSVLILQAITKLVDTIKSKKVVVLNDDKNSDKNVPELELLKSKCGVEDSCVSLTASHGIVVLVEEGILPLGVTLSDFMVNLSTARCYTGITMAIGNLLLLDLKRNLQNKQKYECPFKIHKPQHPLIMVLSQNSEIWPDVYNQIQSYVNHLDHKMSTNSWELLRPLFFYVMCNPVSKLRDTFRKQLWNLLILSSNKQKFLIFEIITWIQTNSQQKCLELSDFLIDMSRVVLKTGNNDMNLSLVLYLTSVVHKLVKYGGDPGPCINMIMQMLDQVDTNHASSILLMILADTISMTPSVYLKDILRLCKKIVQKKYSNMLAVQSVVATILQWLLYPSCLMSESLKLANDIISFIENNPMNSSSTGHLLRNLYFKYIQEADDHISVTVHLCLMTEKWQNDKHVVTSLKEILKTPPAFISRLFNFVSAVFTSGFDKNIKLAALDIMLHYVKKNKELAPNVLVLLLNKLANEREPDVQLAVLRAIPEMAVSKQNIPLIINTLETIRNGPGSLKTLSLDLFLRLWSTENRCFPYLQKALIEAADNWETGIVKANTLKEISVRRPELHGKEMVSHLSQVLNKSHGEKGSQATALAIAGITALCDAEIIDIASTWKALAPKLTKDKRCVVVKSLCGFFAEYSKLRVISTEQQEVVNEAINMLWYYVSHSEYYDVIGAALKALSKFDVEEIALKQLPELYRQNLTLPSSYAKTPMEATRKPEDVLPYIPGECWVKMLQNMNHDAMDYAGDLLIEWIRVEIAGYKSGIYNVSDGKREPTNYNYLPAKSVVRGLGNYIRLVTVSDSKVPYSQKVVRQCLRILGEAYSKPLPPLNWTFLYDLLHKDAETSRACINIACKQTQLSGSARTLIENYINNFQPDVDKTEEMIILFTNLSYLCKSIAPNLIRPMLTNCLKICYQNFGKPERENVKQAFCKISDCLRSTLLVEDIHDANRTLLGQVIESFIEQLDANEEMFEIFVSCLVEAPTKFIERVSSPSLWWETTQEKFERAVKVRAACALRSTKAPFVWLNECISTAATMKSVQIYMLKHSFEVFRVHRMHLIINDWILELMGQVQEKLTAGSKDVDEITFLCDVLLLAVIVFSGHDCLHTPLEMVAVTKEVRCNLFPNAVLSLCSDRCRDILGQIMEWLYHMIEICTITLAPYQLSFYQALTLLRHEKAFIESSKWMKYLSMKRPVT